MEWNTGNWMSSAALATYDQGAAKQPNDRDMPNHIATTIAMTAAANRTWHAPP